MTRPQPVTFPMVLLFSLIPMYLVIGHWVEGRTLYIPEVAWDRELPLVPAWSVVYGSLFLAALLPAFVIHQQELLRRTILAFVLVWLVSFAFFLAYPTLGPPRRVAGDGFFAWALRVIYSSDVRHNCLPSLHVAQCFVAAFACSRVHRGVGVAAVAWACLVGLSTLLTKQHYVLDVVAGALLAFIAYVILLRGYPREAVPARDRRLAPALALVAVGVYGLAVAGLWWVYAFA